MVETMKHTGSEVGHLDPSERSIVITFMRGPIRIEAHPRRRWKWLGKRGWLVVLHLLHEQDDTWRCRKFITSFQDLCTRLGIDPDDPVWQDRTQHSTTRPRTSDRVQDNGWMPFCMF
jgi:hypothetical protein